MDSLSKATIALDEELQKRPVIKGTNVSTQEQLRQDKKEVAEKVREEMNRRAPGFIEELEATLKVVSQSKVSLAFSIILLCFLIFLELFVLTIKMVENQCDNDKTNG